MKEKIFKKGLTRRLFSVVLAVAMVVAFLPATSIPVMAADYWSGYVQYNNQWTYNCYGQTATDLAVGDSLREVYVYPNSSEPYAYYDGSKVTSEKEVNGKVVKIDTDSKTLYICTATDHETSKDTTTGLCSTCDPDASSGEGGSGSDITWGHVELGGKEFWYDTSYVSSSKTGNVTHVTCTEHSMSMEGPEGPILDDIMMYHAYINEWMTNNPCSHIVFEDPTGGSTHTHGSWNYTASGATLTAECKAAGDCTLTNKKVSLTLTATNPNYSGSAATITIEGQTAWEAAGLTTPTVAYEDESESSLASAPTTVGTYYATITAGTATAKVSFTIEQAHGADTSYANDDTNHWNPCVRTDCTDATHKYNSAAHSYNETTHKCVCGKMDPTYHQHVKGTKHEAVGGNCVDNGTIEYYDCAGTLGGACGKYLDASGNELTSIVGTKNASNHKGTATTWTKTATTHKETYGCCGVVKTTEADHTYGTTGTARYTCSVCSYENATKKAEAELADAKTEAKAVIDTEVGEDTSANVKSAADAAKTAIDAATSTTAVTTAKNTGVTAIGEAKKANADAKALADAKSAAIKAVEEAVGTDTAANVVEASNAAKIAIEKAETVDAVTTAKNAGVTAIENTKKANEEAKALADAKEAAVKAIDETVGLDKSANVVAAAADAKAAIEKAETVDAVATAKSAGIEAINAAKRSNVPIIVDNNINVVVYPTPEPTKIPAVTPTPIPTPTPEVTSTSSVNDYVEDATYHTPSRTSEVSVPETYKSGDTTYVVVSLQKNAFNGKHVEKITLPKTIEKICYRAFVGDKKLTEINITSTKLELEAGAFSGINRKAKKKIKVYVSKNMSKKNFNALKAQLVAEGLLAENIVRK